MTLTLDRPGLTPLVLTPESSSYRYRRLSGEHSLHLSFRLERYEELPLGASLSYDGARYSLYRLPEVTKTSERSWHYALTLEPPQGFLSTVLMKHRTDGRTTFPLMATAREQLRMLVDAANAALPSGAQPFSIGSCLSTEPRLIQWRAQDLSSALALLAETFATEWVVEGTALTLGKVERGKSSPLLLSYGQGRGLRSGLRRSAAEGYSAPRRLYVEGSERNIRPSSYGAKALRLPRGLSIGWDGTKLQGEEGYQASRAKGYRTAPDGTWLERTDLAAGGEAAWRDSEVYPSRVGVVSAVREDAAATAERHALYSFVDSSIPEALDFAKCLIPDRALTVAFQSGMLSGLSFEASYDHKARRFALVGREQDGLWMPEGAYLPKVGDKYAVLEVELPSAYLREDKSRSGAEYELLRGAIRHYEALHSEPYTWRAELDGKWASEDWLNRGGRLQLGSYVRLSDPQLCPEGVALRVLGLKDYLHDPQAPELELGVKPAGASALSRLEEASRSAQQAAEGAAQSSTQLAQLSRRSYDEALTTSRQLVAALQGRFERELSPVALRTMQLLVGDAATQLRFLEPKTFAPRYEVATRRFHLPYALIEHQSLDTPHVLSSTAPTRRRWELPPLESPALTEDATPLYVYALCPKEGGTGRWQLSASPLALERPVAGNVERALLVGLLSAATEGQRSFSPLYGFTEILPGQLRVDRIASADGDFVLDLVGKRIIAPRISFTTGGQDLREVITQGDEAAKQHAEAKAKQAQQYTNDKVSELWANTERYVQGNSEETQRKLRAWTDYLTAVIQSGDTHIEGGLVLTDILATRDASGAVRSWVSGKPEQPAFAAGVTDFGTPQEQRIVEIHHDGTARFGSMLLETKGGRQRIRFADGNVDRGFLTIGGKIPSYNHLRPIRPGENFIRSTYIGQEGLFLFRSIEQSLRASYEEGEPMLRVYGETDLPGILAAVEVEVQPTLRITRRWGYHCHDIQVKRTGTGRYLINHDLGTQDYIVQTSAYCHGYGGIAVEHKRSDAFELVTYDRTRGTDGISFAFTLIGDNPHRYSKPTDIS